MSKRPSVDLSALTTEAAAPMPEASQRTARLTIPAPPPAPSPAAAPAEAARTKTADLKPLAFKVPPAFRKRFRQRAADADLKLNELLFAALDAWEESNDLKKR